MIKGKEQICLEAVSQVLRDHYGDDYFSIGRPKECAVCLDGSGNSWKVYCVERGNEFDVKIHHNVVDACVDLIVRIGINDGPENLIDQFYSLIIEGRDMQVLQFDCERKEGRKEGERDGGNKMIYRLVSKGVISPDEGASELGITVEQLRADMIDAGYCFPKQ